ncbi:MAG: amidase [Proteobacteria bacterium]|nr:amidase [Pseudomonadota bacterium]
MQRIADLAASLNAGKTSSRALVEQALAKAEDPAGQGRTIFTRLYKDAALKTAEAWDRLRAAGHVPSPLAGLPLSIKDLCDVAGETTLAGSVVLKGHPPAARDAVAVARLRAAGAVIVGKTNMTEFAYSGLGLNPHYGTPLNPYDRKTGRIPGGSSSGAAVAAADGMAVASLGTDTGGSVRIPAALCGIAGFKPTARRVSVEGILPLSFSLDSVGPLALSVGCCAVVDAVMASEPPMVPEPLPLAGLRFVVPQRYVLDDMDAHVARSFDAALKRLSAAGARLVEQPFAELEELPGIYAKGGPGAAEAYHWHRELLAKGRDRYDRRVAPRILRGAEMTAADYLDVLGARKDLIARVDRLTAPFDAVVMPTVPIVAPALAPLVADDAAYADANKLILRNTTVGNFLDRCALTIPCHEPGTGPVGFSLMAEHGADRRLLAMGLAVEAALGR